MKGRQEWPGKKGWHKSNEEDMILPSSTLGWDRTGFELERDEAGKASNWKGDQAG